MHKVRRGYTMVELLIVIALLGALAVGLLATIDPFEQLKKGRDTSKQSLALSVNDALIRIYGAAGSFPIRDDVTGLKLDSAEGLEILDAIGQTGELKKNFPKLAGKNLSSIYLTAAKDGSRVIVCFTPESKAYSSHDSAFYSASGEPVEDCTLQDCYTCVGNGLAGKPGGGTGSSGSSGASGSSGITPALSPSPTLFAGSSPVLTPTPIITECPEDPVPPPTVSISSSYSVVNVGTPFTVTVSATSCAGLDSVWWYGAGGPDVNAMLFISYPSWPTSSQMFTTPFTNPTKITRAFGSPLFSAEQAVHEYSFTSTLTLPSAGTYKFGANSRDVLYPNGEPHQASEGMGLQFVTVQVVSN